MALEGHGLAEYKTSTHNRDPSTLSDSFPHPNMGPGMMEEDRAPLVSNGRYESTPAPYRGRSESMDIGESRPMHQPPPSYTSNPYSDGPVPQSQPQQMYPGTRMSAYDNFYRQQTSYDPVLYR